MNELSIPPTPPIEILIVEDSPTQALLLQRMLEKNAFVVTSAANGRMAWEELAHHRPNLVISDIQMPEMDGYELCSRIKADDDLKEIPVILLTALSAPEDVIRGLECGADNFIVKPYEEQFLLSRIEFVLANLELRKNPQHPGVTEIYFAGRKYRLNSGRLRSIYMLLSTYETAVQKNNDLSRAKTILEEQAAELLEKNAHLEADLEMARELQNAFLPVSQLTFPLGVPPAESALQFSHRYTATTALGGDFYDIFQVTDSTVGVFVCDVMGHGIRAALITAIIRGCVQEFMPAAGDPGNFLTLMNRRLYEILKHSSTLLFATASYVIVDIVRGELRYASAGHPNPLHLRGSAVDPLDYDGRRPGAGLGILAESVYSGFRRPIKEGDRLLMFTDGLFEVDGPDGEIFDKTRLAEAISRHSGLPTEQLIDTLMDEIREYSASKTFGDDVCLVVMDVAKLGTGNLGY